MQAQETQATKPFDLSAFDREVFSGALTQEDIDSGEYGPQKGDERLTVRFEEVVVVNPTRSKQVGKREFDKYDQLTVTWVNGLGKVESFCTRLTEDNAVDYWRARFPRQWVQFDSTRGGEKQADIPLDVLVLSPEEKAVLEHEKLTDVREIAKLSEAAQKRTKLESISKIVKRAQGFLDNLDKTR